MISCCGQDCVVLLAPYPYNQNPVDSFNITTDFDLQGYCLVWYARPQPFFNCTLCLTGPKVPWFSSSHTEVSLVYFSMFEPIYLTLNSIMKKAGVPMLYDLASNQCLPCLRLPLHLPCCHGSGVRPPHSVFHWRQQSPHDSVQLQGQSASWKRL